MNSRTLIGLFSFFVVCSCNQKIFKRKLTIENGHYRGTVVTDSLGNEYMLRYIPIKITNDNSVQAHLQLVFANEYQFPGGNLNEKFKVIPLPTEWGLDGVDITESMREEIKKYIDNPTLNFTIEPGGKFTVAIGTLCPRPPENGGIDPHILFVQSEKEKYRECDWILNEDNNTKPSSALGLKLDYDQCSIIPCGKISYAEN